MKKIVILITVLVSSISFARNDSASNGANCAVKSLTSTNSGLSDILKVGNEISDEQVKKVARALCINVSNAKSNGKDIPPWKATMEKYLGFKGSDDEFKVFFHSFINSHKNKMICPKYKITTLVYPPQHLFKRILAIGMNETYEEYFFDLDEGDVDFNAYEVVNGKKETVLDWVEKWIAQGRGDAEELRDVAYILSDEYGAKKGKDL